VRSSNTQMPVLEVPGHEPRHSQTAAKTAAAGIERVVHGTQCFALRV
jgi:hypothetical protein